MSKLESSNPPLPVDEIIPIGRASSLHWIKWMVKNRIIFLGMTAFIFQNDATPSMAPTYKTETAKILF
jgi:hypothetical protein